MNEFPHTLKIVTVWLLLGATLFLGFKFMERRQQQSRFQNSGGIVEIQRSADGHYHWPGQINGQVVDFLIDTGATRTAIPQSLARQLRLQVLGQVQSNTAGGVVTGEMARADIRLQGGVQVDRLPIMALVGLQDNPLLGMDVLGKLRWHQGDGVLTINAGQASPY